MEIDFEVLQEHVVSHLADILQYEDRESNLRYLDTQIIGLSDTFNLISHSQAEELRAPVLRELEKLNMKYSRLLTRCDKFFQIQTVQFK